MKTALSGSPPTGNYAALRDSFQALRETERPASPPSRWNELEVQMRFFGGEFGDSWTSLCGREIQLLDPGEWNREAGPDFLGANLLVDGTERLRGDVEIDLSSSGWEQHGHASNPDFRNVALHLFLFSGSKHHFARTIDNRHVLQVRIPPVGEESGNNFALHHEEESIDDPSDALPLIRAAARERMRRKARRITLLQRLRGPKAALFELVATGLGYRNNSVPMALLAQRCGHGPAAAPDGEALLFGLAGFLNSQIFEGAPESTRSFLRSLWDGWWKRKEGFARLILPADCWKFTGNRPVNHPHRRVAALRAVATSLDKLLRRIQRNDLDGFREILENFTHPFWNHHWNLRGEPMPPGKAAALLGSSRATDILLNTALPWITENGKDPLPALETLRMAQIPAKVQSTASWFCPSLDSDFLRTALAQQGLLELDKDFRGWDSPRNLLTKLRDL